MFDLIPEKDFVVVLSEFRRVLRPGGRLVLVNMTKGAGWFNTFWEWLYKTSPSLLAGLPRNRADTLREGSGV